MLERVDDGAAKNAGLKAGDIILKVNERKIERRPDILGFLGSVDANTTVSVTVKRESQEFVTEIVLGEPPNPTEHAADLMEKSRRRDGFSKVISHDADISPEKCGGPVFDLDGNFIGINIARNSRVRTYILPSEVIKAFINRHANIVEE